MSRRRRSAADVSRSTSSRSTVPRSSEKPPRPIPMTGRATSGSASLPRLMGYESRNVSTRPRAPSMRSRMTEYSPRPSPTLTAQAGSGADSIAPNPRCAHSCGFDGRSPITVCHTQLNRYASSTGIRAASWMTDSIRPWTTNKCPSFPVMASEYAATAVHCQDSCDAQALLVQASRHCRCVGAPSRPEWSAVRCGLMPPRSVHRIRC